MDVERPDRRLFLKKASMLAGLLAMLPTLGCSASLAQPLNETGFAAHKQVAGSLLWKTYVRRFMHSDGRIVDTGNGGISHTEGQGSGMLFALAFDDPRRFEQIWHWTRTHLRQADDELFAWRYDPSAAQPVTDRNNASDGDLMITWALEGASQRWAKPEYGRQSAHLRGLIHDKLVRRYANYTVLLPGHSGFERADHLVLNLSYWVMPALKHFARLEPAGPWRALISDGTRLLNAGRFGAWHLPPDWLALDAQGNLKPARDWPARFGFDALRIPLYCQWAELGELAALRAIRAYWRDWPDAPPAWVNVLDGSVAGYPLSHGGQAIRALLSHHQDSIPDTIAQDDDYYSAFLLMMTHLAETAGRQS